jgi:hypothetical protein
VVSFISVLIRIVYPRTALQVDTEFEAETAEIGEIEGGCWSKRRKCCRRLTQAGLKDLPVPGWLMLVSSMMGVASPVSYKYFFDAMLSGKKFGCSWRCL